MFAMTLQNQVSARETLERKPWTSQDWHEISVFVAQSLRLVGAAIFLYILGPALGTALIATGVAFWSLYGSQIACQKEEDSSGGDDRNAATEDARSHCADPAWLRNPSMPSASTASPAIRQGA